MDNNYNNSNGFDSMQPGQPLFGNNFNNTEGMNQNLTQTVFDNNFNSITVMPTNGVSAPSFDSVQQDVPPVLTPIKSLNEAPVVSGPSLDVLEPINIMPAVLPNQDKLNNYENGNAMNNQQLSQNFNQPPVFNNALDNSDNNMPNFGPVPYQASEIYQAPVEQPINNMPNFGPVPYQASEIYQAPVEQPINNMPNFGPVPYQTPEMNQVPVEESSYDLPVPDENTAPIEDSTIKTDIPVEQNIPVNEKLEEEKTYDIVNKPTESESDSAAEIINDLGLEENLSADDIDIMDLEEESVKDDTPVKQEILPVESLTEESIKHSENDGLSSPAVDALKFKVEELKKAGYNIEIDEFDFEQMFQLIIKINK